MTAPPAEAADGKPPAAVPRELTALERSRLRQVHHRLCVRKITPVTETAHALPGSAQASGRMIKISSLLDQRNDGHVMRLGTDQIN
eukprot:1268929-Amphidinium_carterae.1